MTDFIFRKAIVLLSLLPTLCLPAFSQVNDKAQATSPIKWEKYAIKKGNITFLLPKMPIVVNRTSNLCNGEEGKEFASYADGVVYIFRFFYKAEPPEYCRVWKKYSAENFQQRLDTLLKGKLSFSRSDFKQDNLNGIKLSAPEKLINIFNDSDNNRWFELEAISRDTSKSDITNFLGSLSIESKTKGIDIGDGAKTTLGDEIKRETSETIINPDKDKTAAESANTKPMIIGLFYRAPYTDAARSNMTSGVVRLRVTFMANGSIGQINVVSGLADGLTERAIAAAKKIVFLPAEKNGKPLHTTKVVEYRFTIY